MMKDEKKTKEQLVKELKELRQQVAKLEKSETEQKRIKEALQESEKKYRFLFEQCPIGVGLSSFEGKVISCNKAMESITGYSVEELKKINLADTYENPEDRKVLLEALNRNGRVVNFQVRLKRKDGTPYDTFLNISRIHIGEKDLFQTTCVDITEHKRSEEVLRESEDRRPPRSRE